MMARAVAQSVLTTGLHYHCKAIEVQTELALNARLRELQAVKEKHKVEEMLFQLQAESQAQMQEQKNRLLKLQSMLDLQEHMQRQLQLHHIAQTEAIVQQKEEAFEGRLGQTLSDHTRIVNETIHRLKSEHRAECQSKIAQLEQEHERQCAMLHRRCIASATAAAATTAGLVSVTTKIVEAQYRKVEIEKWQRLQQGALGVMAAVAEEEKRWELNEENEQGPLGSTAGGRQGGTLDDSGETSSDEDEEDDDETALMRGLHRQLQEQPEAEVGSLRGRLQQQRGESDETLRAQAALQQQLVEALEVAVGEREQQARLSAELRGEVQGLRRQLVQLQQQQQQLVRSSEAKCAQRVGLEVGRLRSRFASAHAHCTAKAATAHVVAAAVAAVAAQRAGAVRDRLREQQGAWEAARRQMAAAMAELSERQEQAQRAQQRTHTATLKAQQHRRLVLERQLRHAAQQLRQQQRAFASATEKLEELEHELDQAKQEGAAAAVSSRGEERERHEREMRCRAEQAEQEKALALKEQQQQHEREREGEREAAEELERLARAHAQLGARVEGLEQQLQRSQVTALEQQRECVQALHDAAAIQVCVCVWVSK
jgi:hypothetical protein